MKQLKEFGKNVFEIELSDLPFLDIPSIVNEKTTKDFMRKHEKTLCTSTKSLKCTMAMEKTRSKKDKKFGEEIELTATTLASVFKEKKIHVLRYDAFSTNSVYIKLDWGVLGTVRISDHLGKKEYPYKYNLITTSSKGAVMLDKGIKREFFTLEEFDELIQTIEIEREEKILKYGMNNYNYYIKTNKEKAKTQKGFFQSAKEV